MRPYLHMACTGLLAVAGTVSATNGTSPPGATQTDFELLMTSQGTVATSSGCPGLNVTYTGNGLSPQLGVVTAEGSHCAAPDTSGNIAVPEGTMTLRTANGDEMRVRYSINLTPGMAVPVFELWGTYQVVSATGRYANASGRGIVYGLERVSATPGPSGPNMISVKGTLRY